MSSEEAPRLLSQVRRACREVVRRARHVEVVANRLAPYARELAREPFGLPELDPRCHYLGHGRDTVAFMLALEAINFGSGTFPHLRPYDGLEGYFAVAAALRDRFEQGVPSARELAAWSAEDCARTFGQDLSSPPVAALMERFAEALRELGVHVGERYGGRFEALVEAAGGSAERLVALLAEIEGFADVARYGELRVPILKRAQLAAADLSLAFRGEGWGRFEDLHRLTTFADDQVPHVLRSDGLLRYGDELAARLEAGELLEAGSPEEVEIRASAIHAVELLVAELHRLGRDADAMRVDYRLWNRGLEPRYRALPRHRTISRFY